MQQSSCVFLLGRRRRDDGSEGVSFPTIEVMEGDGVPEVVSTHCSKLRQTFDRLKSS